MLAVCLGWLFIVEASSWIFYYLLLRGFVETRYTIFHGAEYQMIWKRCLPGRYTPRAEEIRARFGEDIAPTWLQAEGTIGSTRISVNVGKYVPQDCAKRTAKVSYTNGEVISDFDRRDATITVAGTERGRIAIDNHQHHARYAPDYTVLMSMFLEFAVNGWGAVRFDDLERQLDALDWWDDLCDRVADAKVPVHPYAAHPPSAAMTRLPPRFEGVPPRPRSPHRPSRPVARRGGAKAPAHPDDGG